MSGDRLVCRRCNEKKEITDFQKNGKQGRLRTCKDCRRDGVHAKDRRFYLAHIEKMRIRNHKHYRENKEYYENYRKKWFRDNPEKARSLWAKKYKNPTIRLSSNISRRIRYSLRSQKNGRPWESIVGYNLEQLKKRMESLFTKGMTWDNYGEWHMDHIIPVSFFKYESFNDVEFKMCWRLENLQPLWATDNIKKGNSLKAVA